MSNVTKQACSSSMLSKAVGVYGVKLELEPSNAKSSLVETATKPDTIDPCRSFARHSPTAEEQHVFDTLIDGQGNMGPGARAIKHLATAGSWEAYRNLQRSKINPKGHNEKSFKKLIELLENRVKVVSIVLDPTIDRTRLSERVKGFLSRSYDSMSSYMPSPAYSDWGTRAEQYQKALENIKSSYGKKFGFDRASWNLWGKMWDWLRQQYIKKSEGLTQADYIAAKAQVKPMLDNIEAIYEKTLTLGRIRVNTVLCEKQMRQGARYHADATRGMKWVVK